ncbi:PTI1-like tyrosine-protein kinase At3g15890 isoform X3 [Phragmites australis]|uniref:PTI1-like tyrosine-protein kinase At3g15890 isoform X3 n=1 Tax=Phragmites australis TaxID=29695 RepID=UPI002D796C57|nr:PTI1-like tyrosine-protein kinase At3g15890 isoform X3 [Phragmites australis]
MQPKLSRAARRLLCCGGAAGGEDLSDEGSGSLRWVFSLRELRSATNSFNYDNTIGEGPLGSVYWGQVWDGSQIAVKRLKNAKNGTEVEFASEVEILGRIRHKNLLSLRGYCADGPERILVYDYMANSSLYAHLHGTHSAECLLDWRRRASIAIGASRALLNNSQVLSHRYLHNHATPQIIHGGIKATNVLLDSDFQAHVGDFGLIRLIPDGMDHEKIASENQRGYLAPEYIMFGKPTSGCDVYSFGIILLELASGKRPIEKTGSVKTYGIRNWVLRLAKEGRYDEIADSKLSDKYSESELKRMVLIGLACTHSEPEKRPTMLEVVPLLKGESKEMLLKLETDELFRPDLTVSSHGTSTPDGSTDSVPKKDELGGA